MEKPLDDRCTTKSASTKTASVDTGRGKTAAGIAVYLVEELGDARLRCAQLKKYVSDAQALIEKSEQYDHFMEVAAHLIQGIPDALFRLEKALDAAAMSAARMDYEEIKQNLKPEKAEELETVLQDARIRSLIRRSEGVKDAKSAAEEIDRIASSADATGVIGVDDLMVLIASLEKGRRTAATPEKASDRLRRISETIVNAKHGEVSRFQLAQTLRTFLADVVQPTASQSATALMQQAGSREEVMKGFKESNPDLTDAQLKEIADQWEKNKDVVKDLKAAAASLDKNATLKNEWEAALKKDEAMLVKIRKDIKTLEDGGEVENLTMDGAKSVETGLVQVIENKKKLLSKLAATSAEMLSRFEEGKPADPTKDMSPEDAKKWKEENEKHKDEFKSAGMLARFEEGKPADPTENMSPEDAKRWKEEHDKHKDVVKNLHKAASMSIADALPSLAHGSQMLLANAPAAMLMIATGVEKLATGLTQAGLPVEGRLLAHTAETIQDAAAKATSKG